MANEEVKEAKVEKGLDDEAPDLSRSINLISSDGQAFELTCKTAFISNLVKTSLENDEEVDELCIPQVKADVLGLVVEYMEHHKGVEPEIPEKPLK